ncbi:hypothetical protein BKH42_07830 [Helicobacter sp. 13S00482-2]|uniref:hypothetical protein n=1 Tax=Helicobacter sp. 13S00482-2 TaxID=1476200 RepID=UPI000BA53B78|nr:hypothetical protein [Helicobacter sp. 13S00482-2]PAF53081.1 hypothetical protein BKH42_07830 [Helicobacter sp. 13S00482-2]
MRKILAIVLFFVLGSSFAFAEHSDEHSCDPKSEDSSSLKGNFLKKGKLFGLSCESRIENLAEDASPKSESEEKKLDDLKNFVNSSK